MYIYEACVYMKQNLENFNLDTTRHPRNTKDKVDIRPKLQFYNLYNIHNAKALCKIRNISLPGFSEMYDLSI